MAVAARACAKVMYAMLSHCAKTWPLRRCWSAGLGVLTCSAPPLVPWYFSSLVSCSYSS